MSVAAEHGTSARTSATLPPADAPGPVVPPRLAGGVELLGEYQDSGYRPAALTRAASRRPGHPDVAAAVPGSLPDRRLPRPERHRGLVSDDLGRSLNADQVRYLITAKLLPLGVVAAKGAPAAAPKANPLLALRARGTLLPERRRTPPGRCCGRCSTGPLSWPWWAASWPWTAGCSPSTGWAAGLRQVLRDPVDLLIVLGLP